MSTGYFIDDRLSNWARWKIKLHSGGGNYASSTMGERVDGGGWDAPQVIRNDEADAMEIDAAVAKLPADPHGRIIWVHYIENKMQRVKLQMLGCSKTTYYERLASAQGRVEAMVAEARYLKDQAAKAEKARHASVVQQARVGA